MVVTEHQVVAGNSPEVKDLRCFSLGFADYILGVMHSRKPCLPNGEYGIHVSISSSYFEQVRRVRDQDIETVKAAMIERGLDWPATYRAERFSAGPFAGKGVHVWEQG